MRARHAALDEATAHCKLIGARPARESRCFSRMHAEMGRASCSLRLAVCRQLVAVRRVKRQ